jgi:hypothetical protein
MLTFFTGTKMSCACCDILCLGTGFKEHQVEEVKMFMEKSCRLAK